MNDTVLKKNNYKFCILSIVFCRSKMNFRLHKINDVIAKCKK